jgi:hypothetical protein
VSPLSDNTQGGTYSPSRKRMTAPGKPSTRVGGAQEASPWEAFPVPYFVALHPFSALPSLGDEREGGALSLPRIGWEIGPAPGTALGTPGADVADVLTALLCLRARAITRSAARSGQVSVAAELPADASPDDDYRPRDLVRASRYELISLLGWASPAGAGPGPSGRPRRHRPGRHHYDRLDAAVRHLTTVSIAYARPRGRVLVPRDRLPRQREFRTRVLEAVDLVSEGAGRKRLDAEARSYMEFAPDFLALVDAETPRTVPISIDAIHKLPSGLPRALLRLLTALRTSERLLEVDQPELMARLGYADAEEVQPSIAERRLAAAHRALVQAGVLAKPPVIGRYRSLDDESAQENAFVYRFADALALSGEAEEAAFEAEQLGVSRPMARKLATDHLTGLRNTLRAVRSGELQAGKNLPGLIVTQARGY